MTAAVEAVFGLALERLAEPLVARGADGRVRPLAVDRWWDL